MIPEPEDLPGYAAKDFRALGVRQLRIYLVDNLKPFFGLRFFVFLSFRPSAVSHQLQCIEIRRYK